MKAIGKAIIQNNDNIKPASTSGRDTERRYWLPRTATMSEVEAQITVELDDSVTDSRDILIVRYDNNRLTRLIKSF